MSGIASFVALVAFGAWSLFRFLRSIRDDEPPASRRELARAARDRRPDITPALERDRSTPSPNPQPDDWRWN